MEDLFAIRVAQYIYAQIIDRDVMMPPWNYLTAKEQRNFIDEATDILSGRWHELNIDPADDRDEPLADEDEDDFDYYIPKGAG